MDDMTVLVNDLAKQAGFLAAHAVWCVSDGGPLIPFVGMELSDGKRDLLRFVDEEDLERAVNRAKTSFETNAEDALLATLVYDAYVTLPDGKTDALVVESQVYCEPPITISMVVPYRNSEHPNGFAVFRPKFTKVSGPDSPNYEALGEAFFAGVDSHEKGAGVWNRHLDQTR
jgi:hypothetical protein